MPLGILRGPDMTKDPMVDLLPIRTDFFLGGRTWETESPRANPDKLDIEFFFGTAGSEVLSGRKPYSISGYAPLARSVSERISIMVYSTVYYYQTGLVLLVLVPPASVLEIRKPSMIRGHHI